MNKTTLYIVRHGESLGNQASRFLGHTDLDLSPKGYEQAALTAKELSTVHFDAIYSSDLIRAYNTALPHAKIREMDIITSEKLREIYAGKWEGMYAKDIIEQYGELFTVKWRREFGTFTIPGGESVFDAGKRFYDECLSIANRHQGLTVLITAHAAVIRSFWGIISGYQPSQFDEFIRFPSNASYSIAEYDGEKITPVSYSNDSYMGELFTTVVDR